MQGDWIELLASGLTFDMTGLAPGEGLAAASSAFRFGFKAGHLPDSTECVTLGPGAHIASGATLAPVLRAMLGLAADLTLCLPVVAVGWEPAGTLMEPRYFARIVMNWLGGGPFPALGLAALAVAPDGSVASHGLAHFTGQEMQLQARAGEAPADAVKLAVRIIDLLVREARLQQPRSIAIDGCTLHLEPSRFVNQVWAWRED